MQRIETLEVAVQIVEQLWIVSREEVHLTDREIGRGGWNYIMEATYRGCKVAAMCLHSEIVSNT